MPQLSDIIFQIFSVGIYMSIYLGNSNDKAGNLTKKSTPEGIYSYEYDAQ